MTHSHLKKRAGFTLVELMVAVGLFAVVMTLASGAYLITIKLNAHAQATALTVDNLSFGLENMTRKIRIGSEYVVLSPSSFQFKNVNNVTTIYDLYDPGGGAKKYIRESRGGIPYVLTDTAQLDITSLNFVLTGAGADNLHPFVRVRVSGTTQAESGKSFTFSVQTAISMQDLE